MTSRDLFYQRFLDELDALDRFLIQRRGPESRIDRMDPDVRRIMESLAFFSARTQQLATERVNEAVQRVGRGYVEQLLFDEPARALICAQPNDRLMEPVTLPQGTLVRLTTSDDRVGLFTTMRRATLLPLEVRSAALEMRPGSGFRILIGLHARSGLRLLPQALSFYLDYLGDYGASVRFHHAVRTHLSHVSVAFGEQPAVSSVGTAAETVFGENSLEEPDEHQHPVSRVTSFFHFPERDLFMHIDLPVPDDPWHKAWIALDLDEDWPTDLVVNREIFQLFTIPVENLRRDLAEPILCDGTKDSYPLSAPPPYQSDTVHSVAGVYREVESGYQPLLPAHLAPFQNGDQDNYELYYGHLSALESSASQDERPRLRLEIANAFEKPCKVSADVRFHQPEFAQYAIGRLSVSLQTRRVDGVHWSVHGQVRPHRASSLQTSPFELLHLLALKNKDVLDREEILYLMSLVGADDDSTHGRVSGRLAAIHAIEERSQVPNTTPGVHYQVVVMPGEEREDEALLADYLAQMQNLLQAWSNRRVRVSSIAARSRQSTHLAVV